MHLPALEWRRVIESREMEQAMQHVQLNLRGKIGVKDSRLRRGRIRADHDFTVLKCEDIGSVGNAAESFMERGHSPIAHDEDINLAERRDLGFSTAASPYKFTSNSSEPLQLACR
jgi:hypothetical protein